MDLFLHVHVSLLPCLCGLSLAACFPVSVLLDPAEVASSSVFLPDLSLCLNVRYTYSARRPTNQQSALFLSNTKEEEDVGDAFPVMRMLNVLFSFSFSSFLFVFRLQEFLFAGMKRSGFSDTSSGFVAGAGGGICQTVVMGPCTYIVTALVTNAGKTLEEGSSTGGVEGRRGLAEGRRRRAKGGGALQKVAEVWKSQGLKVRRDQDRDRQTESAG